MQDRYGDRRSRWALFAISYAPSQLGGSSGPCLHSTPPHAPKPAECHELHDRPLLRRCSGGNDAQSLPVSSVTRWSWSEPGYSQVSYRARSDGTEAVRRLPLFHHGQNPHLVSGGGKRPQVSIGFSGGLSFCSLITMHSWYPSL